MQLNRINITSDAIIMKVVANNEPDNSSNDLIESKVTGHTEPLPSFTAAFAALPAVFAELIETGSDWAVGLNVTGLTISRTKHGTRSVQLFATKQLEIRSDFLAPFETPMLLIDELKDGESGAVRIPMEHCEKIATAIHEAEKYMNGERAQATLNFNEAKAGLNALAKKGKNKDQPELAGVGS